jgi:peptidoglycan/LPS O-acetylase OafA/YrhL
LIWVGNGRWLLPYAEKYVLALPLASVGAVAIFLSALGPAESTGWLRGNPILLYLGQISYGLYIFHELAIELVTQHWWKSCCPTTLQFITCSALELALTIALASLSWRYFELPFLRLKNRFLRFDLAPTS